jgi:hypothetical protein
MTSQAAISIVGDSAMLSREQLQQISTSIDDALRVSSSEPRGLLIDNGQHGNRPADQIAAGALPESRLEQPQMAAARSAQRVAGTSDRILRTTSPTRAGFYWAKWLAAEPETPHAQMLTPSDDWEIVWVFENSTDRQQEDFLRVLVIGVEASQSIRNFEWGSGSLARRERRNRI